MKDKYRIACCPECDKEDKISPLFIKKNPKNIFCQDGHTFANMEELNHAAKKRWNLKGDFREHKGTG